MSNIKLNLKNTPITQKDIEEYKTNVNKDLENYRTNKQRWTTQ